MNWIEMAGVALGLLYLYFEYRASVWLWATSIVMPAVYIYVYYSAGFYADMGINVYYLLAGIYGWWAWLGKGEKKSILRITRTPVKNIAPLCCIFVLFFVAIAAILINFTDSTVPYGDSFTTALSIIGLWMLSKKYVEQWLVWLIVDIVCTALYVYKGLYPTAALYGLYCVIAVAGYYKWLKLMHNETLSDAGR